MKDKLAEFIDDYNCGRVSLEDTMRRLDFDRWKQDKIPLPQDYMELPRDPLDIVLEKERVSTLVEKIKWIKQNVSDELWQIFVMVGRGFTQEKIANALNVSQPTISRRLHSLRSLDNLYELLHKAERQYTAVHPKSTIPKKMRRDGSHTNGEIHTEKIKGWRKEDAL